MYVHAYKGHCCVVRPCHRIGATEYVVWLLEQHSLHVLHALCCLGACAHSWPAASEMASGRSITHGLASEPLQANAGVRSGLIMSALQSVLKREQWSAAAVVPAASGCQYVPAYVPCADTITAAACGRPCKGQAGKGRNPLGACQRARGLTTSAKVCHPPRLNL
jgi:hypothetical protein